LVQIQGALAKRTMRRKGGGHNEMGIESVCVNTCSTAQRREAGEVKSEALGRTLSSISIEGALQEGIE